jgi:hypothetical protein
LSDTNISATLIPTLARAKDLDLDELRKGKHGNLKDDLLEFVGDSLQRVT